MLTKDQRATMSDRMDLVKPEVVCRWLAECLDEFDRIDAKELEFGYFRCGLNELDKRIDDAAHAVYMTQFMNTDNLSEERIRSTFRRFISGDVYDSPIKDGQATRDIEAGELLSVPVAEYEKVLHDKGQCRTADDARKSLGQIAAECGRGYLPSWAAYDTDSKLWWCNIACAVKDAVVSAPAYAMASIVADKDADYQEKDFALATLNEIAFPKEPIDLTSEHLHAEAEAITPHWTNVFANEELPELTDEERKAMDNIDMTPVLGSMSERLRESLQRSVRFMRERNDLREQLAEKAADYDAFKSLVKEKQNMLLQDNEQLNAQLAKLRPKPDPVSEIAANIADEWFPTGDGDAEMSLKLLIEKRLKGWKPPE